MGKNLVTVNVGEKSSESSLAFYCGFSYRDGIELIEV